MFFAERFNVRSAASSPFSIPYVAAARSVEAEIVSSLTDFIVYSKVPLSSDSLKSFSTYTTVFLTPSSSVTCPGSSAPAVVVVTVCCVLLSVVLSSPPKHPPIKGTVINVIAANAANFFFIFILRKKFSFFYSLRSVYQRIGIYVSAMSYRYPVEIIVLFYNTFYIYRYPCHHEYHK